MSFEDTVDKILVHVGHSSSGVFAGLTDAEAKAALLAAHEAEVEYLTDWGSWLKDRCDLHNKYTSACCGCQKANHALGVVEDYKDWLRAERRRRAGITQPESTGGE